MQRYRKEKKYFMLLLCVGNRKQSFNKIDSFVTVGRNDLVSQNKVESPIHYVNNQEEQGEQ